MSKQDRIYGTPKERLPARKDAPPGDAYAGWRNEEKRLCGVCEETFWPRAGEAWVVWKERRCCSIACGRRESADFTR